MARERMSLAAARSRPRLTYVPPGTTLLYRLYDEAGTLLYVGVTRRHDLRDRFNAHSRTKAWWSQVTTVELASYPKEHLALEAERHAIQTETPRYNIRSVRRAS